MQKTQKGRKYVQKIKNAEGNIVTNRDSNVQDIELFYNKRYFLDGQKTEIIFL